jgi:hypothetical protein
MFINMETLRDRDRRVFGELAKAIGSWSGTHEVQLDKLPWPLAVDVRQALGINEPNPNSFQKPLGDEINVESAATAVAEQKRQADEKTAFARAEQYVNEQGLDTTDENAAAITSYVNQYYQGYWSPQIVDNTIAYLSRHGKITFTKKVAAAPATPAPVTRSLPNGEVELPLNASEGQMRAASIEQLKDLSRRRNEGKQKRKGEQSFATNLFDRFSR